MTKETLYMYLGTNGTIISPVHLEDIYYVRRYHLYADAGKVLTKDGRTFKKEVEIPEADLDNWVEVKDPLLGQK